MPLFDIVGNTITVNPETLRVPELNKIWTRDKSKDKKTALDELSYVVFLCNNTDKNPYKNYSETDRRNMLSKDFNVNEDAVISAAIDKYKKLNTTRYERVVSAALGSLEDIEHYYLSIKDNITKDEFDVNDYLSSMEKLGKAIKSLRELEKVLEADRQGDTKVKGGNEIGDYELPD